MCLGIPGQVVEKLAAPAHLARVDIAGVRRVVDVGLLEDEELEVGDWVLIHVGFALSKIDEEEAAREVSALELLGAAYTDELAAIRASRITAENEPDVTP
jgi:hydrogenase expression/formation protein HypC